MTHEPEPAAGYRGSTRAGAFESGLPARLAWGILPVREGSSAAGRRENMRALPDFGRHWLPVLVGLVAGAIFGAFAGGMAALYVPEEFSRTGFIELVLVMAGGGAVAGLIQSWLH